MRSTRRGFIAAAGKSLASLTILSTLPRLAWGAWNADAFSAEKLDTAIAAKFGNLPIQDSTEVQLKAPAIAENGAVVPITVKSGLKGIKNISVFVENNPSPLAASFNIHARQQADVSVRIRMGETSKLIVLVQADGKLHRVSQEVKVTIGGCGG
ncbi:MAG: thiosulfate oxidation carrier protein SoxY [Agarilytica sp.]